MRTPVFIPFSVLACLLVFSGCSRTSKEQVAANLHGSEVMGFVGNLIVPVPPGGQYLAGVGYNSLNAEPGQFALQGSPPLDLLPSDTDAQTAYCRIQKIESKSQLSKELDFSLSASYGGFGSVEVGLVNNSKVNSYSLSYLLSARVQNPSRVVAIKKLSD